MFNLFKKSGSPSAYVLSGYLSQESYDNRQPEWEGDKNHQSYDEAVTAAVAWHQAKGSQSTVEVIELRGRSGHVRAVIDQNGLEVI